MIFLEQLTTSRPILFVPNYYWIFLPCSCLHEQWDLNTIFLSVLPSADALSYLVYIFLFIRIRWLNIPYRRKYTSSVTICFAPLCVCVAKRNLRWLLSRFVLISEQEVSTIQACLRILFLTHHAADLQWWPTSGKVPVTVGYRSRWSQSVGQTNFSFSSRFGTETLVANSLGLDVPTRVAELATY